MNTLANSYDTLEQLIYDEDIRIKDVDIHPDMDMLLIILNTGSVLQEKLSNYPRLRKASSASLKKYKLIGKGTGIHWADLDEDISLKGLLRDTIKNQVLSKTK